MAVGFTNWVELGFFPLQDHEDGVPLGMRQQLAGGRVISLTDGDESEDPADAVHVIGVEDDMGTIGDLWPWGFWQTRDREERHTGVWAQAWAGLTVEFDGKSGGPITGPKQPKPTGVLPIITSGHGVDGRMKTKAPNYPKSFATLPEGWDMVVMPGMEETAQHLVQISADPRIVVSNVSGPGTASTLFVDLQPDNHPCMDYAIGKEPGQTGRSARSASMFKVIPLNSNSAGPLGAGDFNGIAWNCALSKQERALGLGMCWIQMNSGGGSGPITGGPVRPGPITPMGGPIRGPITPMRGYTSLPMKPNYGKPGTEASFMGGGKKGEGLGGGESGDGGDTPDGPTANANSGGLHDRDRETPDDWGKFSGKPQGGHGVTFMAQLGACGPLDGGWGSGDKHAIGSDEDGNPMVSAHISSNAYFIKDQEQDAPLEFGGFYPKDVQDAELKVRVYLDYDRDKVHKWIKGSKPGLWRWWSTTHVCIPTPMGGPMGGPMGRPMDGPITPVSPMAPGPITPVSPRAPGPITPGSPRAPGPITPMRGYTPLSMKPNYGRPITGGPAPITGGPTAPGAPAPAGPRRGGPITGGQITLGPMEGPTGGSPDDEWERIPVETTDEVGGSHGAVSLLQIYHPTMEGFSGISFRPQQWTMGAQSTIHDRASSDSVHCAEQTLPQVLAAHAFGGVNTAGEFAHVGDPRTSRARGGTAFGGVMFVPPEFEPEDYLFETGLDVDSPATESVVLATPGTSFAIGKPTRAGGVVDGGGVIRVNPTNPEWSVYDAGSPVQVFTTTVVSTVPYASFKGTSAIRIPSGTTAQQPTTPVVGDLRFNTDDAALEVYGGSAWSAGIAASDVMLLSGANSMAGDLNVGGFNLVNAGKIAVGSATVDGGAIAYIKNPSGSTTLFLQAVDNNNKILMKANVTTGRIFYHHPSRSMFFDTENSHTLRMDLANYRVAIGQAAVPVSTLDVVANPSASPADAKAITARNSTAATSGNQKYSPSIVRRANGWDDFGAASTECSWRDYCRPVQVSGSLPDLELVLESTNDGASWTEQFTMSTVGGGLLTVNSSAVETGAHLGNVFVGVGKIGTGFAAITHWDMRATSTAYGLLLEDNGNTYLNAATGRTVSFRINNVDVMTMDSDSLNLADSNYVELGTGGDARIYYDGTDLQIKSKVVGSGKTTFDDKVNAVGGFEDNGTAGIDKTFSFSDGALQTHSVVISGGIITQWNVA